MKIVIAASCLALGTSFNFGGGGGKTTPTEKQSIALPFTTTNLDTGFVGDFGFDPLGLANLAPDTWWNFEGTGPAGINVLREAELMHGRIAQLACLGWVFPEIYHFPGNAAVGEDAYAAMNPYDAIDQIPGAAWPQILVFMSVLEIVRLNRIKNPNYMPGDFGLGQGEGRWNPFNFEYTPEQYEEKQLQEIKHCRLAMLGIVGLAFKSAGSDIGVLAQLGESFSAPNYVAKAGYFFPEGI
mmetsp:Transcript_1043/g.1299  ORF Transcript_1043/g.1299 Transcript_1043/m.1299 type:complete len:240 (-) Transcript_1043:103-822(-)|eukprot:CAMPEP_0197300742 /NCGR_PEP_ID=MMETSP0890-20130614/49059_1 /TAXON_ID=44058 ORGANISM="Aureoumbra lagunensis, Strain CCMP1510" /NCGR_SAMPLE_ID=MMETSP0890 /ASSEMBLY_ACC=CAM_ASM_000533 /LENGTH=239 /DNA_ID=CAMNT_0042779737 /DNA_START=57 /DNA_END=776 /DNA_ORIENTATION=+